MHRMAADAPTRKRVCRREDDAALVGKGVAVRPSTLPGAGLGLFAVDAFASRDIVTEYAGRALSRAEARATDTRRTHIAARTGTIVLGLHDADAAAEAGQGGGSFANDCFNAPPAMRAVYNVELYDSSRRLGRLYLRVRPQTTVRAGDELFLNYGRGGRAMIGM